MEPTSVFVVVVVSIFLKVTDVRFHAILIITLTLFIYHWKSAPCRWTLGAKSCRGILNIDWDPHRTRFIDRKRSPRFLKLGGG
jgi:hypothetical protein